MDATEKKLIELRRKLISTDKPKPPPRWKRQQGRIAEWHYKATDAYLELAEKGQYLLTRVDDSKQYFSSFLEAAVEGEKTIEQVKREQDEAAAAPVPKPSKKAKRS